MLPNAGPGLSELEAGDRADALDARGIAEGLAAGELAALLPAAVGPPGRRAPERDGHAGARASRSGRERAVGAGAQARLDRRRVRELPHRRASRARDVVFPAEAYAEKEGTIIHPDGRIQRLRPAVAHPGATRAQWLLIVELAARLGLDLEVPTGAMASEQLFDAVPFYAGLTLEEIGGKGVRWQDRAAAAAYPGREQLV